MRKWLSIRWYIRKDRILPLLISNASYNMNVGRIWKKRIAQKCPRFELWRFSHWDRLIFYVNPCTFTLPTKHATKFCFRHYFPPSRPPKQSSQHCYRHHHPPYLPTYSLRNRHIVSMVHVVICIYGPWASNWSLWSYNWSLWSVTTVAGDPQVPALYNCWLFGLRGCLVIKVLLALFQFLF